MSACPKFHPWHQDPACYRCGEPASEHNQSEGTTVSKDKDELRRMMEQRREAERAQRERDAKMDDAFDKDAKALFGIDPKERRESLRREMQKPAKSSGGCAVVGALLLTVPTGVVYGIAQWLS